ncbi:MAG: hypothetical protein E7543_09645 [Ruminococcaceae bacterium]|nr:hypothetical protein [Oscillospiraceae bacterium]
MKRMIIVLLCIATMFSFFAFSVNATEVDFVPYVVRLEITEGTVNKIENSDTRASGLIRYYSLYLSKTGSTLNITGTTTGSMEVVRSGFKDLVVQRRKTSDDAWKDYYEYGNLYVDAFGANLDTTLAVAPNYQYRITCKHYAKKSLLVVQTISNVSNIVTTV